MSENPFTDPLVPDDPQPQSANDIRQTFDTPQSDMVRHRLRLPAYALLIVSLGQLGFICYSVLAAIFSENDTLLFVWVRQLWDRIMTSDAVAMALMLATAVSCLAAVLTIISCTQMLSGDRGALGLFGILLTCVPIIGTAYGLALPIGVWALIERKWAQQELERLRHSPRLEQAAPGEVDIRLTDDEALR